MTIETVGVNGVDPFAITQSFRSTKWVNAIDPYQICHTIPNRSGHLEFPSP